MARALPHRRTGAIRAVLAATLALASAPPVVAEPVTIAHRWGETRVDSVPERIVTLSYTGVDAMLALGLVPIAYRTWYGGDARGLWPWAAQLMPAEATPLILRGEIDPAALVRLRPDLVEATYSGITRPQYRALSRFTPVLPPLPGQADFATTWDRMLLAIGEATGRRDRAEAVIAALLAEIAAVRAAHPDWEGRTAVVALPDGPAIFSENDGRTALMQRLGFVLPEAARGLGRGAFFFEPDRELTAPLEADVILWLDAGGGVEALRQHPLRHSLRAVREGREIVADPDLTAALSYASPLSLPYALERLVPLLEAALDGDPATVVEGMDATGLLP
ncbi:MAG: ABC transporter substrate-binding protein [Pseudomonadota bacterium]